MFYFYRKNFGYFFSFRKTLTIFIKTFFKFLYYLTLFNFIKISFGTVMIWHPHLSAWKILNTSLVLAHNNFELGNLFKILEHLFNIIYGSTPVSAILPAKTESIIELFFLISSINS